MRHYSSWRTFASGGKEHLRKWGSKKERTPEQFASSMRHIGALPERFARASSEFAASSSKFARSSNRFARSMRQNGTMPEQFAWTSSEVARASSEIWWRFRVERWSVARESLKQSALVPRFAACGGHWPWKSVNYMHFPTSTVLTRSTRTSTPSACPASSAPCALFSLPLPRSR